MPTRTATAPLFALLALLAGGCTKPIAPPRLGELYDPAAMHHGPDRNPVIVIPGILGSRLIDPKTDTLVWGAFGTGSADPNSTGGARLIALPMQPGVPLDQLRDRVVPDGALGRVRVSIFGLPLELEAYASILATLGVGGYTDQTLGGNAAVDYGTDHYTCFQFDYDWRRDNVESAALLLEFIGEKRAFVQQHLAEDHGGEPGDYDVKFDLVAHSMGGLLARYMLRYGDTPPEAALREGVTWKGAEHVERVVLVGVPNAGSVDALASLVGGLKPSPFHDRYDAALLGTMPAIYQVLPRDRHGRAAFKPSFKPLEFPLYFQAEDEGSDADGSTHFDFRDLKLGMLHADSAKTLKRLMPDTGSAAERRRIAADHVDKCLRRAAAFQAALDVPAELPPGLSMTLYAGDAEPTEAKAVVSYKNEIDLNTTEPGDGIVTRASALMDERQSRFGNGKRQQSHLVTPIDWTDVNFLYTDHLGLTADPTFSDNVLHLLLESPHVVP